MTRSYDDPPDAPLVADGSGETAEEQLQRLATFIIEEVPGEPSQSQGAVDTAVRLLGAKPTNPLGVDQRARAEALRVARSVLVTTGFASSRVGQGFSTDDLITVADWIVSGPPDLTPWRITPTCEVCGHFKHWHDERGCNPGGMMSGCSCVGYVGYMEPGPILDGDANCEACGHRRVRHFNGDRCDMPDCPCMGFVDADEPKAWDGKSVGPGTPDGGK